MSWTRMTIALASLMYLYSISTGALASTPTSARERQIAPQGETDPSSQDDTNDAAIWIHPKDLERSLILGSAGSAGLELFGFNGKLVGRYPDAEIDYVDVSYGFELDGDVLGLVVAYDRKRGGLLSFAIDPGTLQLEPLSRAPLLTGEEVTGLCLYRSSLTAKHYAFAATDDGVVQQWELFAVGGKVDGRLVRTVPIGMGASYCAVDSEVGELYIAEESVGIWKLPAEPESDAERVAVDLVKPHGQIESEVKGLALYKPDGKTGYLIAGDVGAGRFNVYEVEDSSFVGSFVLKAGQGIDSVDDAEGIALTTAALGELPGGLFVAVDQDNDGAAGNLKFLAWEKIAASLGIKNAAGGDPRKPPAASARTVEPVVETEPAAAYGDAADDMAIWIHPTDAALSLVIGANKKYGLETYDLQGKRLQTLTVGRMNNVDLREGFLLDGRRIAIVATSNRTDKTLGLYTVDPVTRRLSDVAARNIPLELQDPYGLCMYRSPRSGEYFVFINSSGDAQPFKQWRLFESNGKVDAELVREFTLETQAEGCVADDVLGHLYVGEEDIGVWRYSAEPQGGAQRRLVDSTDGGNLRADVEGITLYDGPHGSGYLIVSSQGANNYAVYRREENNAFVGVFHIVANDELGIDGASETDGLDVTAASLGPAFPHGLLVVQDGRNITPRQPQNFKLLSWEQVAESLGLSTFSKH